MSTLHDLYLLRKDQNVSLESINSYHTLDNSSGTNICQLMSLSTVETDVTNTGILVKDYVVLLYLFHFFRSLRSQLFPTSIVST